MWTGTVEATGDGDYVTAPVTLTQPGYYTYREWIVESAAVAGVRVEQLVENLRVAVQHEHVAVAALTALAERGEIDRAVPAQAIKDLGLNPDAPPPWTV